jgi:hypothetical protein
MCGNEKKPEHAEEGRSEKAADEVEKNQSMPAMKKKKTNERNNGY